MTTVHSAVSGLPRAEQPIALELSNPQITYDTDLSRVHDLAYIDVRVPEVRDTLRQYGADDASHSDGSYHVSSVDYFMLGLRTDGTTIGNAVTLYMGCMAANEDLAEAEAAQTGKDIGRRGARLMEQMTSVAAHETSHLADALTIGDAAVQQIKDRHISREARKLWRSWPDLAIAVGGSALTAAVVQTSELGAAAEQPLVANILTAIGVGASVGTALLRYVTRKKDLQKDYNVYRSSPEEVRAYDRQHDYAHNPETHGEPLVIVFTMDEAAHIRALNQANVSPTTR